jgi:hypothetical protein
MGCGGRGSMACAGVAGRDEPREQLSGVQDERCFNAFARTSAGRTRLVEGLAEEAAYGEVVWFWRPLLALRLRRQGSAQPGKPRR